MSVNRIFSLLLILLFSCVGSVFGQSADQLYSGGRQAFTDGLWPTSASQFTRLLREYPEDHRADSAAYMAAVAYYNAGDYERSIRILEAFPGSYPDSAWNQRVAYWEGLGRYARNDWNGAARAFRRQTEMTAETAYRDRALLYLGACYEKLEDWEEAEEVYTTLESLSRDYELISRAVFRLGQIRLADDRPSEALVSFNRLAFDYPDSPLSSEADYWVAECHRRMGRDESALESYRIFLSRVYESGYRAHALLEAARLSASVGEDQDALAYLDLREQEWAGGSDSERPAVVRIRAASYLRTGQLGPARENYSEILRKPVNRAEEQSAAFNLAQTWIGTRDEIRAVSYLKRASRGPDDRISSDALYTAGQILLLAGNDDGADSLGELADRYPADDRREEALRLVVKTRTDQDRLQDAIDALDDLVFDYPDSAEAPSYLFLRGDLHLDMGDESRALSDYAEITRRFPRSEFLSDSFSRIGFVYAGRGEHIRAADYYLKSADAAGGVSGGNKGRRAVYSAGVALSNGRDTAGAVRQFSSLVEADPSGAWGIEAAYHLGETYYDDGEYRKAREAYAVAARYGDDNWAFESAYAIGWTWFRQSDWEAAEEAFENAYSAGVTPEQKARSRYRVGLSVASSGDWSGSLSHYESSLEYGRASWREEALYQYAWALLNQDRREDAFDAADTLSREYPASSLPADLPFRMGENSMSAGDYTAAIEWYDICVVKYPDTAIAGKAGLRAALASREAGRPADAAARYADWVFSNPGDPGVSAAARSWADALLASGDPEAAADAAGRVLEADPDLTGFAVPVVLAWVRIDGIPTESAEFLDRMGENEDLPPTDRAEALLLRAHLYRYEGQNNRARQIYEVLIRDIPGRIGAESQEGLARSYADEGRLDEAAEAYLAVPYLFPDETDLAARALREAERLYREAGRDEEADRIRQRIGS